MAYTDNANALYGGNRDPPLLQEKAESGQAVLRVSKEALRFRACKHLFTIRFNNVVQSKIAHTMFT